MPYAITTPEHGTAFDIAGKGIAKTKATEDVYKRQVENNGVAALATQLAIPAQDNRPELINMTWVYPNGDKGVSANAMFLKKDAGKYEADVKKALQSIKFDK